MWDGLGSWAMTNTSSYVFPSFVAWILLILLCLKQFSIQNRLPRSVPTQTFPFAPGSPRPHSFWSGERNHPDPSQQTQNSWLQVTGAKRIKLLACKSWLVLHWLRNKVARVLPTTSFAHQSQSKGKKKQSKSLFLRFTWKKALARKKKDTGINYSCTECIGYLDRFISMDKMVNLGILRPSWLV